MRIEAAVIRGADSGFQLEQVELAEPGPDQILVQVHGVGFCHTDLLPRTSGFPAAPPIISGHEGAGVIVAAGTRAGLPVGGHVVLTFDSCGTCPNCLHGRPAHCRSFFTRNLTGRDVDGTTPVVDRNGDPVAARWFAQSSFATYALAGVRNAVPVPDDLPLPLPMLGPLGCGVQTGAGAVMNSLRVPAGSSIVVYGAGGVGLSAVMAARIVGAATIVVVDRFDSRLDLALDLGATHVVRSTDPDPVRTIRRITSGGGDFALDTTGQPEVIAAGVDALRPTGTIGLVGSSTQNLVLGPTALLAGKNVHGILEGDTVPHTFIPQLLNLWRQDRFPFDRLVRTYPLRDINRAEHDARTGLTIKPVLIPEAA